MQRKLAGLARDVALTGCRRPKTERCYEGARSLRTPVGWSSLRAADDRGVLVVAHEAQARCFFDEIELHRELTDFALEGPRSWPHRRLHGLASKSEREIARDGAVSQHGVQVAQGAAAGAAEV